MFWMAATQAEPHFCRCCAGVRVFEFLTIARTLKGKWKGFVSVSMFCFFLLFLVNIVNILLIKALHSILFYSIPGETLIWGNRNGFF